MFFLKKEPKTFYHKEDLFVALRTKRIKVFCFFFSKKKSLSAACLLALVLGSASAASAQPKTLAAGKLPYGVAASFAPFEYQKDGTPVGFDIELIAALSARLGLAPVGLNMDFNGLIPALQGGRIDIINSAMYITAPRAAQVAFVPYLKLGNEIVVAKGDPLGVHTHLDLCGHRVAVTLGAIEETYARLDATKCHEAGRAELTVITLPTAQDSALSLRQGRADAFFDSTPGAVMLTTELPDVFEVAGETFESNTRLGIALRKGETGLQQAIEGALHQVVADGTYARLLEKYHLPATSSIF